MWAFVQTSPVVEAMDPLNESPLIEFWCEKTNLNMKKRPLFLLASKDFNNHIFPNIISPLQNEIYEWCLSLQSDLDNLTWHEIQRRVREVQLEQQMCIHKRDLTELDIYHRILRYMLTDQSSQQTVACMYVWWNLCNVSITVLFQVQELHGGYG